jgi:hypothetical protein
MGGLKCRTSERWRENVARQAFIGMEYYSPKLPCDATQPGRFRKILGEAGVEQLLKTAIETAVAIQTVKKTEFERVIGRRRWPIPPMPGCRRWRALKLRAWPSARSSRWR